MWTCLGLLRHWRASRLFIILNEFWSWWCLLIDHIFRKSSPHAREYILIWSPHRSWERWGITLVIIYTPIHPPGRIRPGGKGFILACLPCVDTWTGPANWDVRACVSTDPWLVFLSYLASHVHRFSFWRKKRESEFCVLRRAVSFSFQIPFQKCTICFSQILLHWAKPLNPPVCKPGHRDPSRVSDTLSRSNKLVNGFSGLRPDSQGAHSSPCAPTSPVTSLSDIQLPWFSCSLTSVLHILLGSLWHENNDSPERQVS